MSDINGFALFGIEQRPWLDVIALEAQHRQLSAAVRQGEGDKREGLEQLERAKRQLHDPATRLRYLRELEFPNETATPSSTIPVPPSIEGLFSDSTVQCARLDALLARKTVTSSALGRALLASEAAALHAEAETWLMRLSEHEERWTAALREWDIRWQGGDPTARSAAMTILFAHVFTYLGRWRDSARERIFALLQP